MTKGQLALLMATNPQALGYQMDDQSRQHRLDQTSGDALANHMDKQASLVRMIKALNYLQAGIGIPAGAVLTATGDPMMGIPAMAWGGLGLTSARVADGYQRELSKGSDMWRANPMSRRRGLGLMDGE